MEDRFRPDQAAAFTFSHPQKARELVTPITFVCGDAQYETQAIWDTGATNSCISQDVASALNLTPTGMSRISTAKGPQDTNIYLLDCAILPNKVRVDDIQVSEVDIGDFGALVGMDIINLGDFAISNHNGGTVFTFRIPSVKTTDYVKEAHYAKTVGPLHGKGKRKHKK